MLEEKNYQQRNHQKVKTQVRQDSPHKQKKGQTQSIWTGDQRDHTTEPHRIPTIEVHPTKRASKVKHQEVQKKEKELPKWGDKKQHAIKRKTPH